MSTPAPRIVAATLLTGIAWMVAGPADAIGCGAPRPLSPEAVVKRNITGRATIEFTVGEVILRPASWAVSADDGWKAVPLTILPKDAKTKDSEALFNQFSVLVSGKVSARLRQLGIESRHFQGKVLRVSGIVRRMEKRAGPVYQLEINNLDQVEFIRQP